MTDISGRACGSGSNPDLWPEPHTARHTYTSCRPFRLWPGSQLLTEVYPGWSSVIIDKAAVTFTTVNHLQNIAVIVYCFSNEIFLSPPPGYFIKQNTGTRGTTHRLKSNRTNGPFCQIDLANRRNSYLESQDLHSSLKGDWRFGVPVNCRFVSFNFKFKTSIWWVSPSLKWRPTGCSCC